MEPSSPGRGGVGVTATTTPSRTLGQGAYQQEPSTPQGFAVPGTAGAKSDPRGVAGAALLVGAPPSHQLQVGDPGAVRSLRLPSRAQCAPALVPASRHARTPPSGPGTPPQSRKPRTRQQPPPDSPAATPGPPPAWPTAGSSAPEAGQRAGADKSRGMSVCKSRPFRSLELPQGPSVVMASPASRQVRRRARAAPRARTAEDWWWDRLAPSGSGYHLLPSDSMLLVLSEPGPSRTRAQRRAARRTPRQPPPGRAAAKPKATLRPDPAPSPEEAPDAGWGDRIPLEILVQIFGFLVAADGPMPFLGR